MCLAPFLTSSVNCDTVSGIVPRLGSVAITPVYASCCSNLKNLPKKQELLLHSNNPWGAPAENCNHWAFLLELNHSADGN